MNFAATGDGDTGWTLFQCMIGALIGRNRKIQLDSFVKYFRTNY